MTTVIGIDPSLTGTGIAYGDGTTTTLRSVDRGDARLQYIAAVVADALDGDTFAIIEDLPTHAHGAGKTGMVQGVIRLTLLENDVAYATVPAASLKKFATGRGNATKADMRMSLFQRAGVDLRDDNQVDAWWLRQIGLHLTEHPDRLQLPKTHLVALDKINGAEVVS